MHRLIAYTCTLFLLFPGDQSFSQTPSGPTWSSDFVYFETAKLKINDAVTSKPISDIYKTATIQMKGVGGSIYELTLDIPDYLYMKEAAVIKTSYENDDENIIITYSVMKDNQMAAVLFQFKNDIPIGLPAFIIVAHLQDAKAKSIKKKTYTLYEFKDNYKTYGQ